MEHVREDSVTPCKGDLPGLVREVSLHAIAKFRRDAQSAEAPPGEAGGVPTNREGRGPRTHALAKSGIVWFCWRALHGQRSARACFAKPGQSAQRRSRRWLPEPIWQASVSHCGFPGCGPGRNEGWVGLVRRGVRACVPVAGRQAAPRVCNPAGLKMAECGKHLDQKSQQRIENKSKKPVYSHERMLFQKCTPHNAVIDRRGHQAVTHGSVSVESLGTQ